MSHGAHLSVPLAFFITKEKKRRKKKEKKLARAWNKEKKSSWLVDDELASEDPLTTDHEVGNAHENDTVVVDWIQKRNTKET